MSSLNELVEKCIQTKVVPITGYISDDTVEASKKIIGGLIEKGSPDIAVLFDSNGGHDSPGLWIYDMIKTYPGRTTGIVYHRAKSMAAIILQACDERLCFEHGAILVHDLTGKLNLTNAKSPRKFRKWLENLEKWQSKLDRIVVQRTGKTLADVRRLCAKDEDLGADEAVRFGLIDRILTKQDMVRRFRPDILPLVQNQK